MAALAQNDLPGDRPSEIRRAADLLGGEKVLLHVPEDSLGVHEMLLQGLPFQALTHLIDNLLVIRKTDLLEKAIGMSVRTFKRRKVAPLKPLSNEQSDRVWKFAEVLTKGTTVFGSQADAERWMEQPAIGLNQRCPIDLLATVIGVRIVEAFLDQLTNGIYV